MFNIVNFKNKYNLERTLDKKPLVRKYLNGDFRNNTLIPVVIYSKKMYGNQDMKDISHHYVGDFYKELENISICLIRKNVVKKLIILV